MGCSTLSLGSLDGLNSTFDQALGTMKFFAILILPKQTNTADSRLIEQSVSELMRPFKMWDEDVPVENGRWDYYWCCSKEWLEESSIDYSVYGDVSPDQSLIVFPVECITVEGVTDSIVTPDGEWHRSKASYIEADPSWETRGLEICRSFPGHFGVLVYCHG